MQTEEQKVQELLKPRWKVIAGYPNCPYKVGAILDGPRMETLGPIYDGYPHLFRKLEWWEDRKSEEMPEYVKNGKDVYKAKWKEGAITENGKQPMRLETDSHDLQVIKNVMCFFEPATSADYTAYIEKQPTTLNQGV